MNGHKLKASAQRNAKAVKRAIEGKIVYATVESGNYNNAGQANTVSVVTEEGLALPTVNAGGHKLAEGTRVRMRARGLSGSERYTIEEPVALAMEQEGGGQNHVIDTPDIAEVKEFKTFLTGGIPVLWVAIVIWQIIPQWRYGQHTKYEVQWREASGNQTIVTIPTEVRGQIAFALDGAIDTNDDPIQLAPTGVPATSIVASPRFGRIEFLDGEMAAYSLYNQTTLEMSGLMRGVANSDAVDTDPASHGDGELVRVRTTTVTIPNIQSATAYQYRTRAIIGPQTSNWSGWENYVTGGAVEATRLASTLITNGDFPSDTTGWTLGGVHSATLSHDANNGFVMLGCAKISEVGAGSPSNPQLTQSGIAITEGRLYTVRVYLAVNEEVDEFDTFRVQLAYDVGDTNYSSVVLNGDQITQVGTISDNIWTMFEVEGIAPHGATTAIVTVSAIWADDEGDTLEFYVDDVGMVEKPISKEFLSEEAVKVGGGATLNKQLKNTAALNFGSISAHTTSEMTITVTGAASGDGATVTPTGAPESGLMWSGYVSASNTVTVRLANVTASPIDPANRTWLAEVRGYA